MNISYLVRFQECRDHFDANIGREVGTQTVTKVGLEGPDSDITYMNVRAIPNCSAGTGTMTTTRVGNEHQDSDDSLLMRAIPPLGGQTLTKTAVALESDDKDSRQLDLVAIPKCYSY